MLYQEEESGRHVRPSAGTVRVPMSLPVSCCTYCWQRLTCASKRNPKLDQTIVYAVWVKHNVAAPWPVLYNTCSCVACLWISSLIIQACPIFLRSGRFSFRAGRRRRVQHCFAYVPLDLRPEPLSSLPWKPSTVLRCSSVFSAWTGVSVFASCSVTSICTPKPHNQCWYLYHGEERHLRCPRRAGRS